MWNVFMIDQFHDVLPGTCTELTLRDTRKNSKELNEKCHQIIAQSISHLFKTDKFERAKIEYDQI